MLIRIQIQDPAIREEIEHRLKGEGSKYLIAFIDQTYQVRGMIRRQYRRMRESASGKNKDITAS